MKRQKPTFLDFLKSAWFEITMCVLFALLLIYLDYTYTKAIVESLIK